ncbi:MAG TPA: hypothetical protein VNF47_19375 [Streptosporangiaceae bacterium]|nr:hypothetical protein [Streptosporangiaceae bacterium]
MFSSKSQYQAGVLPVKENRRGLFGALAALPWDHGRITTRTIQVLPERSAPRDAVFISPAERG